jgi:hypothetical protein
MAKKKKEIVIPWGELDEWIRAIDFEADEKSEAKAA